MSDVFIMFDNWFMNKTDVKPWFWVNIYEKKNCSFLYFIKFSLISLFTLEFPLMLRKTSLISIFQAQLALKDEKIEELTKKIEEIDRELLREARIQELHRSLQQRDIEIQNLRSQLDKFQSVLVVCNPASPKGLSNNVGLRPRKQRAGISAEPQSEASILELSQQTFPTIYKSER